MFSKGALLLPSSATQQLDHAHRRARDSRPLRGSDGGDGGSAQQDQGLGRKSRPGWKNPRPHVDGAVVSAT